MNSSRSARPSDLRTLLDYAQLAEQLCVTERHIRRLVAERRIPFVKVGRFVRFDPLAIEAWLDSCAVSPLR